MWIKFSISRLSTSVLKCTPLLLAIIIDQSKVILSVRWIRYFPFAVHAYIASAQIASSFPGTASTWYLFLKPGTCFADRFMYIRKKESFRFSASQSRKPTTLCENMFLHFRFAIMSHNTSYYLKKLSKKPPPGCAKLENFRFGRRVAQYEPSPAKSAEQFRMMKNRCVL